MRFSQTKWGCHTLRFSQDAASTVRQHKASADVPKGPYGEAPDGASLGVVVDAGVGVAVGADVCAGVVVRALRSEQRQRGRLEQCDVHGHFHCELHAVSSDSVVGSSSATSTATSTASSTQ